MPKKRDRFKFILKNLKYLIQNRYKYIGFSTWAMVQLFQFYWLTFHVTKTRYFLEDTIF